MILIDSDVAIDVLRKHSAALSWLGETEDRPTLTGYSAMELVQGCRDGVSLERVDRLLSRMTVIWPDERVCATGFGIFHRFHLSHGVGPIDSLIAATAIQYDVPLLSFNRKHFGVIPRIVLVQPYER